MVGTHHSYIDSKSFNEAAKYNTENNRPEVYTTIEERHNWYIWASEGAKKVGNYWFEAAVQVTSFSMVGGAEQPGSGLFMSKATQNMLKGANEFLLKENFKTFGEYATTGGNCPITWNGKSYGHLKGADLDNQMVVIEMTNLQGYLDKYMSDYIKKNGKAELDKVHENVNDLFASKFWKFFTPDGAKYASNKFKEKFGGNAKFDFMNKEHRIFQGQMMAEYLRKDGESKEKKKK